MFSFKKIAAAAVGVSMLVSATPSFAGDYAITVINNTQHDVWITWYIGPYYGNGQAGTACVRPGSSTVGDDAADWKSGDGTVVRAELKDSSNCGGKTLNKDSRGVGQGVWVGKPPKSGTMKLSLTENSSHNSINAAVGY